MFTNKQIRIIESELNQVDTEEAYRDFLDECYGMVDVAGLSYQTSQVLEEIDPTAFRCGHNDWLDSELKDGIYTEVNGEYYFTNEIDSLDLELIDDEETDEE